MKPGVSATTLSKKSRPTFLRNGLTIESLKTLESISGEDLINLACDIPNDTYAEMNLHELYRDFASAEKINSTDGIVLTPRRVAKYMVQKTLELTCVSVENIRWCDPCSGSGIFIEEIIQKYFESRKTFDAPFIAAFELSSAGSFITLLNIIKAFENNGEDGRAFIKSNKFMLLTGDALIYLGKSSDLFTTKKHKFDVVIGNPPYVRSNNLTSKYKNEITNLFENKLSSSSDLYHYFILGSLLRLDSSGILCFITPANFFRSHSASKLRVEINKRSILRGLVDLDELKIFPDADIHTCIFWLQNEFLEGSETKYFYKHIYDEKCLDRFLSGNAVDYEDMSSDGIKPSGWVIKKDREKKPNKELLTLTEAQVRIFSGIRPPIKRAFVWQASEIERLPKKTVEKWFKPCRGATEIQKWRSGECNKYILFATKNSEEIPGSIIDLIKNHQPALYNNHDYKNRGNRITLRSCSYYHIFDKPRIVFPDISSRPKFSLETQSVINLDGSFIIESSSLALLGVLNSSVAWSYFSDNCSSVGNVNNKGRLRLKKVHVEKFPIPQELMSQSPITDELANNVRRILEHPHETELEENIDNLVKQLYGLQ